MTELLLSVLTQDGPKPMAKARGFDIELGREVASPGIEIPGAAVSSLHGALSFRDGYWFYKDYGSSNGSFLNGKQLNPEQIYLVRNGDILRLADVNLQLSETLDALRVQTQPAILVFRNGELQAVVKAVPNVRIKFGGSGADFPLYSVDLGVAGVEVSYESMSFYAAVRSNAIDVLLNDVIINARQQLNDRDELIVADYHILINDPDGQFVKQKQKETEKTLQLGPDDRTELLDNSKQAFYDSEAIEKQSSNQVFGKTLDSIYSNDESISFADIPILKIPEHHPAMRSVSALKKDTTAMGNSTEDKIILGLGIVMVLALILLVFWWLFF